MKWGMTKWIALALALLMVLSASALAAETVSEPFRVNGATQRPAEEQAEQPAAPEAKPQQGAEPSAEPEGEPQQGAEPSVEPEAEPTVESSAEPEAEPTAEPEAEPTVEPTAEPEAEPAPSEEPVEASGVVAHKIVRTGAKGGKVNLRASASGDSKILATLNEGDAVDVLADKGGWTQVRAAGGIEGYVATKYLADPEPVELPVEPTAEPTVEPAEEAEELPEALRSVIVVLSEGDGPLAMYAEPSADSEVLAQFANGELLSAAEIGGEWTLIVYDGAKGYVRTDKIALYNMEEPAPEEEQPEVIRSITVVSSLAGATEVYEGTPVTLSATLSGFEDVEYRMQWQMSADGGATVVDIPGATGAEYSFNITEENASFLWRLSVTILAEQQTQE